MRVNPQTFKGLLVNIHHRLAFRVALLQGDGDFKRRALRVSAQPVLNCPTRLCQQSIGCTNILTIARAAVRLRQAVAFNRAGQQGVRIGLQATQAPDLSLVPPPLRAPNLRNRR